MSGSSPNKILIENFNKLIICKQNEMEKITNPKDKNAIRFKVNTFKNVLTKLENYPNKIESSEQVKSLKGFGKGTLLRIDEILETGSLKECSTFNSNNSSNDISSDSSTKKSETKKKIKLKKSSDLDITMKKRKALESVTGIGPSKARKLQEQDITLEKLLDELKSIGDIDITLDYDKIQDDTKYLKELTHHQLLGIKYYHDILDRIPRNEIEKIEKLLKKTVKKIDKDLEVIICGSYRRKQETSGDIDVLILHPKLTTQHVIDSFKSKDKNFLILLVQELTEQKILVDHLTENGYTKYMGICKLNNKSKGRRIDIRFIPYESKAAAMLYFTGSGTFNKKMRAEALLKDYTINEYGIYKTVKDGKKKIKGELVKTFKEEDIFKLVGMDYLDPEDRI